MCSASSGWASQCGKATSVWWKDYRELPAQGRGWCTCPALGGSRSRPEGYMPGLVLPAPLSGRCRKSVLGRPARACPMGRVRAGRRGAGRDLVPPADRDPVAGSPGTVQAEADEEGCFDWSVVSVDSAVCRAHKRGAGARKQAPRKPGRRTRPAQHRPDEALGRSRGGLSTKIHLSDEGGLQPLALLVTPGHHWPPGAAREYRRRAQCERAATSHTRQAACTTALPRTQGPGRNGPLRASTPWNRSSSGTASCAVDGGLDRGAGECDDA